MSISTLFSDSLLSALEQYTFSQDKNKFLASLPEGMEKKILNAITLPYTLDLKEKLTQSGVPAFLVQQIIDKKQYQKIQLAKQISQVQDIVNEIKKSLDAYFRQTKPIQQNRSRNEDSGMMGQQSNERRLSSKVQMLDGENFHKYLVRLVKQDQNNVLSFSDYAIRCLPQQVLLNLKQDIKGNLLNKTSLIPTFSQDFVAKFYKISLDKQKQLNQAYQLPIHCYNILPASHINKLAEVIPRLTNQFNFLTVWFSVNYQKKYTVLMTPNSKLSISEKQDKRVVLLKALQQIKKVEKLTHEIMAKQIQLQLLILDLSMEDANLQRFINYISTIKQPLSLFNQAYNNNFALNRQNNSQRILRNIESANKNLDIFLQEYIIALFKKYDIDQIPKIQQSILKFIDQKRFQKLKAKVLLSRGFPLQESNKFLPQNQKVQIRQKRQLTICDNNKNSFRVDQQVILKIKIKNVNKIVVKIYELNLQKHYIQKKVQIEQSMNLHFLDPTYQFVYQVQSNNPYKEEIFDMAIKQIKKQKGVYVVDLDGSGISSRAIIRKGSVFCLKRITLAGLQLKFYDQLGKKIDKLGIWIRGQLINIKGSHILPFGEQQQTISIIAVVGNYAQLFSIKIPIQSYKLTVSTYYNEQSFIVGGKAKIILNPRLYINQVGKQGETPISLKLLKNIRVNVQVTDHENLKSTISFENAKWTQQQDYVIQIPIQTYIRNVMINASSQIKKYNGKKQILTFNQSIPIISQDQLGGDQPFKDFYLKKIGDNYILHALGMDGEPLPRSIVHLTTKMKWVTKENTYDLQSDENGQINLGSLKFAEYISVQPGGKRWNIGSLAGTAQVLKKRCFKQGQFIRIPLPPVNYEYQLDSDISIFYMGNQTYLENMTKNVKIKDGYLQCVGLPTGKYTLTILSLNLKIAIVVLKGKEWQNPNQIYDQLKSTVYQFTRNSNHYLNLSDPSIQQSKQGINKISIKIIKPENIELNQSVKAHVYGLSFIPPSYITNSVVQIQEPDIRFQTFKSKGNTFLSNKKLSQQASYVLNRKNQKQFVGNNLQKPHILLNRIKVRDTVQKQQELTGQTQFNKKKLPNVPTQNADLLNITTSATGYAQPVASYAYGSVLPINPQFGVATINSHNNFLSHSGLTIQNIKNSTIQFQMPDYYSYIVVTLISNNSKIIRNYSLAKSKLQTKKISHSGLQKDKSQKQSWSMSRQIYSILEGQSKCINRTSKWCCVSLLNVIQFAKAQNINLDSWIEKWSTFSDQSKLELFNKKACHQLNNYIKHHDQAFFTKVVEPYIRNKINKTFVDLCLLQEKVCQQWISLQYFDQLNPFEKVLLIEYLAKKGKIKQAQALATSMQLLQKTTKYSFNDFKQKFETMMNAEIKPVPSDPFDGSLNNNINIQPQQYAQFQPAFDMYNQAPVAQYQNAGLFGAGGGGSFGYAQIMPGVPAPPPPPSMALSNTNRFEPPVSRSNAMYAMNARMPATVTTSITQQSYSKNSVSNISNSYRPSQIQFTNQSLDDLNLIDRRQSYVQSFKEVQKTEQFTQVTYDGIKNISQINRHLVPQNKFWVDLALYFANGKNNKQFSQQKFVSDSIIYISQKRSFTLAVAFIPKNLNADYEISTQGSNVLLTANKPFLLFIKQIKLVPFNLRQGLMINHRFFDPLDTVSYQQDGTQVEKEVDQFINKKQYSLQTLVTNTTGKSLQIQLLVDIPQGAIPLNTKQYTQITNCFISPYSTQSLNRNFYFPKQGQFSMYPANVCWGKNVIAKSESIPNIIVKPRRTTKKLQTFLDVLSEGEDSDIINYLQTKNIFDNQIFRPHQILWMLKQKGRFQKIINILRDRGFIHSDIWRFGYLHDNLQAIKQFMNITKSKGPISQSLDNPLKVFQYYPYYSSRAHKYQNQNKSKIRNVQFKETYFRFLFEQIAYYKGTQKPNFKLAAAYYLLLQDRVDQASKLVQTLNQKQKSLYELQFDYLQSFLDMYEGFPNFSKARKICTQYTQYPVSTWRNLFNQITLTLKDYDNAVDVESQQKKIQYRTSVINEGDALKISIPAGTKVEVMIYSVNLQLLFSNNPFSEIKQCSSVRPAKIVVFQPQNQSREQRYRRPQDFKDVIVQIFKSGENTNQRKVDSILWINPNIKSKINQKKGSLQIFYKNKPVSGCYCKVYSTGSKGERFYRDGYSDITGTFKYALSELKEITQFSILSVTDFGGIISKIAPPSQAGQLNV